MHVKNSPNGNLHLKWHQRRHRVMANRLGDDKMARRFTLTLAEGLDDNEVNALVSKLLRVKGVYSVTPERDPNQIEMFGEPDAPDNEYRNDVADITDINRAPSTFWNNNP